MSQSPEIFIKNKGWKLLEKKMLEIASMEEIPPKYIVKVVRKISRLENNKIISICEEDVIRYYKGEVIDYDLQKFIDKAISDLSKEKWTIPTKSAVMEISETVVKYLKKNH